MFDLSIRLTQVIRLDCDSVIRLVEGIGLFIGLLLLHFDLSIRLTQVIRLVNDSAIRLVEVLSITFAT